MSKIIALTLILGLTTAGCKESSYPASFTVNLKNDIAEPLSGFSVQIGTFSHWMPGEGFGKDIWDNEKRTTDDSGTVVFDHPSKTGEFGINLAPGLPKGYYVTWVPNHKYKEIVRGKWSPENPVIEVVLRRIKNPVPMFANNLTNEGAGPLGIPVTGKDCAYDFEAGNWVAPYGNGRTGDIVFHGTFETEASGDSKQIIKITFPGEKDGLIAFDRDPWHGSELRSDYEAPAQGYESGVTLLRTIIAKKVTDDAKPDRNYYFRVRTRLDKEGNIISANFGKIYGDFMSFIYYFNPKPNDRNVEFDPKHNLFRNQTSNQMVLTP